MAYSIRAVNASGIITKTYLYDTPEDTLSTNPVSVNTPEGTKYAATDLSTQKSYLKCVGGDGTVRRINAKSKDVYVTIIQKAFGYGEVAYPIKGDNGQLSSTRGFSIQDTEEAGAFPVTISAISGTAFSFSSPTDRYHFKPIWKHPCTTPGFGLQIEIKCGVYVKHKDGSEELNVHPYGSYYLKGGAGSGIKNSISRAGGSGRCSITGEALNYHCGTPSDEIVCGCTYVSKGNYKCSWAGCSAETPLERGGYGAEALRFVTLPALTDKSFRSSILSQYENVEKSSLNWSIVWYVPAPASSMYGKQGSCTSSGGYCGSYHAGTVIYSNGSFSCINRGCTAYTTNAVCNCAPSKAGVSINGPDGGMDGIDTPLVGNLYPLVLIESIQ